jgi:cell division septation protein DedD
MLVFVTFVGACMFVVGILVGRGTAPVRFDIQALQKELAELRRQVVEREQRQAKIHRRPIETKAELDFYEALKEEDVGEEVTLKPPPPPEPREKSEAVPARPAPSEPQTASPALPARAEAETPEKPPAEPKVAQQKPAQDTARPEAAAERGAASGPSWTVQVASMREWGAAADTVALLKRKGFPAYLVEARIPEKGTWYRVRVGSFTDENAAADTLARLRGERFDGILVPRR